VVTSASVGNRCWHQWLKVSIRTGDRLVGVIGVGNQSVMIMKKKKIMAKWERRSQRECKSGEWAVTVVFIDGGGNRIREIDIRRSNGEGA